MNVGTPLLILVPKERFLGDQVEYSLTDLVSSDGGKINSLEKPGDC